MKIAITGSSGFIGKHTVRIAKERGHEVVEIDIRNEENPKNLLDGVYDLVKDCDSIIHLAALIDIQESFDKATDYFMNNTIATGMLPRDKHIVLASSAAVYSKNLSPYALSKIMAENILQPNACRLRVYNPFGQGEDHDPETHLIPRLCESTEESKVVITQNGEQIRDFIYVTDVAMAFVMASENQAVGVYDICSGVPLEVKEVVAMMEVPVTYIKDKMDKGDTDRLVGSHTQFTKATGWKPEVDVKLAIRDWKKWHKKPIEME